QALRSPRVTDPVSTRPIPDPRRSGARGRQRTVGAADQPLTAEEAPHQRGRARARRVAVRGLGVTARPGVPQLLDQPQLEHGTTAPGEPADGPEPAPVAGRARAGGRTQRRTAVEA